MLAIIGSGETSPTMVTVHRDLLSRLGSRNPRAILLATPYAFQVNADDVSVKARTYFARSVGLDVRVAPGTSTHPVPDMAPPLLADVSEEREAAGIRTADWIFCGPGSPTYALAHWRSGPVAAALRDRILACRGVTILASAAAATAGLCTVPVYEIYKAGLNPTWVTGLDLFGTLGLKLAVIPHYDNAEGRNYDTRYCYLGERRLAAMEQELPSDAAILGVDEHTALLVGAESIDVRGRGSVTIRRPETQYVLPSGTTLSIADLRDLAHGTPTPRRGAQAGTCVGRRSEPPDDAGTRPSDAPTLPELIEQARSEQDPLRFAEVALELETAIQEWGTDTDEDQGTEQARALLRALIGRLGQAVRCVPADPAERLRPAVQPLVSLRARLRDEGRYAAADVIRDALAAAGLEIRDTPDGTWWEDTETS